MTVALFAVAWAIALIACITANTIRKNEGASNDALNQRSNSGNLINAPDSSETTVAAPRTSILRASVNTVRGGERTLTDTVKIGNATLIHNRGVNQQ